MESVQQTKNIIIANQDLKFAEQMKKKLEHRGLKVIEIIVVLEHLLPTIEEKIAQGTQIYGLIISSSIAKNNVLGKRLELLSDSILTIRERQSDMRFLFLSDESEGHPLLAELVSFGIYNIFTRNASTNVNIDEFVTLMEYAKTFADVKHLREVNPDLQWRNRTASTDGARSINVAIETTSKSVVIEKEKIVERERIVEKPVVQIVEKVREIKVLPKLIAIGSAYSGAGSTFVTLALSRILHHIGISNAVVEHPTGDPVLYSLLFGEKKCPHEYKFLSEQVQQNGVIVNRRVEWNEGNTSWYPIHPEGLKRTNEWSSDDTLKMLYHVKEPIVLLDVSHKWSDPTVRETCLSADEIFCIVDPLLPIRFFRQETKKNTDVIFEIRNMGKPANIIANRDVKVTNRNEWLRSLPLPPISVIQEFPYSAVIDSIWNNKLIADDDDIRGDLIYALYGVINRIVPKDYPISQLKKQRRGGLIGKLFGG
ncbi:hypothetical protein M5X11_12925 [Paenibacillus alginolyticus]|uniref:hypothetical protein n=1 Tax=Paenibacillus alginolyticus TaxID=59839 RepID=UPI000407290C|nr:hypothetical protein [Paenibacillus alginolyticus]MCY9665858.1 hypothetical protein [Paenibacillus alginolyticus]